MVVFYVKSNNSLSIIFPSMLSLERFHLKYMAVLATMSNNLINRLICDIV